MRLEEFFLKFSYTVQVHPTHFLSKLHRYSLRERLPLLALVATALLFVINNSTVRILNSSFSPLAQVFWRMVVASFFAYFFFRKQINFKRIRRAPKNQLVLLVLLGIVSGGIATVFRTLGFLNTTLINVQLIDLLAPAIVYAYSLLLLKKRFNWRLFGLTLLSVYGVLIIATNTFLPSMNGYGKGELFATLAVLTTSMGFIMRKVLTSGFNAAEVSWTSFVFSGAFLLALIVMTGTAFFINLKPSALAVLLINGMLTCLGIFLLNYAMGYVSPTLGSQVNQLKIVFTLIIGFVFFHELPTRFGAFGGSMALAAVYGLHRFGSQAKKS